MARQSRPAPAAPPISGCSGSPQAKEGDIVFVSAAAGAVGSAVVQIAKAKGMTVIGSAGGADKCAWVRELGADAAIDYKAGPVRRAAAWRRRRRGSTSISTMSAATISTPPSPLARPERALRDLRDDRRLQYGLDPPIPLHHADHRDADHAEGLHLHRLYGRDGRLLPRHGRLDRRRRGQVARDRARGDRGDARRLSRPVQRREYRARCWSGSRVDAPSLMPANAGSRGLCNSALPYHRPASAGCGRLATPRAPRPRSSTNLAYSASRSSRTRSRKLGWTVTQASPPSGKLVRRGRAGRRW